MYKKTYLHIVPDGNGKQITRTHTFEIHISSPLPNWLFLTKLTHIYLSLFSPRPSQKTEPQSFHLFSPLKHSLHVSAFRPNHMVSDIWLTKTQNRSQNKHTQLSLSPKFSQRKWEPSPKGDGKNLHPSGVSPFLSLTDPSPPSPSWPLLAEFTNSSLAFSWWSRLGYLYCAVLYQWKIPVFIFIFMQSLYCIDWIRPWLRFWEFILYLYFFV